MGMGLCPTRARNFRSLFYFIYFAVNSWYLNKPDEDWYWPVKISCCLISPCKSLLGCDWSRSFWIRRWARLIVHGIWSVFFTVIQHALYIDDDDDDDDYYYVTPPYKTYKPLQTTMSLKAPAHHHTTPHTYVFNNYSSSPNRLWVNSPWGRRPNYWLRGRESERPE